MVISGSKQAVEKASALAKEKGASRVLPLPVSVPSHCQLMQPAAEKLAIDLETINIKTQEIKLNDANFDKLLKHIPEINLLNCNIESISFDEPIDSSNMNISNWVLLAELIEKNYYNFDGFVVLHGSDTMSYTASAISFMFENLTKPIIFTGSQLPIGDLRTDAKENLITSIQIASSQEKNKPVISEVCLYFEYKLYRANRTTKLSAEQFEAFASMNYPPLAESGVHLHFNTNLLVESKGDNDLVVRKKLCTDIAILKLFPGISLTVVESILKIKNIKGIILETYGAGNAPNDRKFIELLSSENENEVRKLGLFIYKSFEERNKLYYFK